MRKQIFRLMLCLVAAGAMMMSSCKKEEGNDDQKSSIIGHWKIDHATQYVSGNEIDYTPFLGQNFQLIFKEDGTLITTDGTNDNPMQYVMEGDRVGFIQAPGLDPVWYDILTLTEKELTIESGAGTEYVTDMYFNRD